MEQNFQTSFIPKKPITDTPAVSSHGNSYSFFTVISVFIFLTIAIASGGVYFYQLNLNKQIADNEQSLASAKGRLDSGKITELQELDKRLNSATTILNKHIAISQIFSKLSDVTLKSIRYTKFSSSLDETTNKLIVNLAGEAKSYRDIALQNNLFSENKEIVDPIFSNLSVDKNNNVVFDLEFGVDPGFVNYTQLINTQTKI